jgi:hypothetical protein
MTQHDFRDNFLRENGCVVSIVTWLVAVKQSKKEVFEEDIITVLNFLEKSGYLNPNGEMYLEKFFDDYKDLKKVLLENGWTIVKIQPGYNDIPHYYVQSLKDGSIVFDTNPKYTMKIRSTGNFVTHYRVGKDGGHAVNASW